jgi:hypothetical protein
MSAVLTKKPGGDYATQLTFPAVFAAQAKASNLASQFYPDAQSRPVVIPRGSGLQEDYHEQKRLDANRRCLNGVRDNAASTARFLSSHANYIVPKPVLSQRKYANPSNGNQADIYSSRPIQWNQPMRGGVLRTKEGQDWAIGKLKERIPQLDAITAAKEAFLMGMPMGAMGAESVGISDITTKVELYGLLTRVESDVEQDTVDKKTVDTSQSLLKLMFAFIPYADVREVEEVMESVEYIQKTLDVIAEKAADGEQSKEKEAKLINASYLSTLYDNMRQYLVRMNGVLNRPRKEREKASSVFIKSLGFSELERKLPRLSLKVRREMAERDPDADPDAAPGAAPDDDDDGKYDDDEEDDYARSSGLDSFGPARPPPRAPRDEEREEEDDDPQFSKENRDELARRSGTFLGQAAPEDPAIRSTGSESAEMPVLPEETEESIARRSGLLAAEAAVSEPAVRSPPPSRGPRGIFQNLLPEEEKRALERYEAAAARLPGWFNETSLTDENLDETVARARQEAPRPYKGTPNSRRELRRAMKNRYADPSLISEIKRLKAKNKDLNEKAKAAQRKPQRGE